MRNAVIEISGRQHIIEKKKFYDFNNIKNKDRKYIFLNKVLYLYNTYLVILGKPYLNKVQIRGKIIRHLKSKKLLIYKMKRKKKMQKKQGHRQKLTRILIENIFYNYGS
uniref:Ribosomal protein L21 n=1 Tax=Nitzschia sp. NIES-3576 TaxID=2083273 RepID=A0A2Z5ZBC3_9STRA|nr:ribosomal protein L21 [Nitzschia sp. NIES-3576]